MYATIRHCARGAASTDDLARAGHALATHLSRVERGLPCEDPQDVLDGQSTATGEVASGAGLVFGGQSNVLSP